jgi:hypothetical protein
MSGTDNAAEAITDGARLLAFDLARVSGALEEIATTWRRAWPARPELPLLLPLRLQDAARELAADARGLAAADPPQAPGGLSVTSRLSALEDGIASAQAMTRAPGMPPAGDAGLWEYLDTALRQAGTRLPSLPSGPA